MTSPRRLSLLASMLAAAAGTAVIAAAPATPASKPTTKPAARRPLGRAALPRHQQIDHGPFVTATIAPQWPVGGIVNKAVAVRLPDKTPMGQPADGGLLFDTDTCRVAAQWLGGFVEFTKDWTSVRDSTSVRLVGTQVGGVGPGPGWARPGLAGPDAWRDPRPAGVGPLPADWVKYKGLYRYDSRVVLAYTVGRCDVMEVPAASNVSAFGRQQALLRTLRLGRADHAVTLAAFDRKGWTAALNDGVVTVSPAAGSAEPPTFLTIANLPPGARWVVGEEAGPGRVLLNIPAREETVVFSLHVWSGPTAQREEQVDSIRSFQRMSDRAGPTPNQVSFMTERGGPALWPEVVTTVGVLGQPKPDAAYVVDTIALPDDNPWRSWMRPGGFDFFTSDPTKAAVCNWSGDVWTVSGLGGDLKELKWKRFASGLFQPLGLRIVNDQVYVLGRDQVTRLVDLNGDGEADFYENFNNDVQVTPSFHEFAFDLQTDAAGNFYFAKAGPVKNGGQGFDAVARDHGTVMKLSPDGKTLSTYATGLRAPNGIGVGPDGQVTTGDNEGTYVPKCRINWVKPGGFYGVVPTSHRDPPPTDYDRPLCWMPKTVDNSSGGQVWVTSDKWGDALRGRLLHLSYGTCSLFLVSKEEVDGQVQGGVVRLPLSFDSGIMRARFNPADGQLYVAGLKGWQTSAGKDGCFQRVRYTGKPVKMPTDVKATKSGLTLTFSCPLDKADANDVESYSVERWNYVWKDAYGSNDWSVADPAKQGHDPVKMKSATLQPDGRTVVLEIPDMRPAMQYRTEANLRSADGVDVRYEVYHTVHALR